MFKKIVKTGILLGTLALSSGSFAQTSKLLNASYDVSRELFSQNNPQFEAYWKKTSGKTVQIEQSHAGSSKQAQAIVQGLQADVVTFNQVSDIDFLVKRKMIRNDWQKQFANNSSPYYSTIVFLVRKGNPKKIKGWDDLARSDVKLVFANPKTSGNGRYTYLAAWLYANKKFNGNDAKTRDFIAKVLQNVQNYPTGGRGATVAFAQNMQGDVLLSFESEIRNIADGAEFKNKGFEVITPTSSILAQFPVAVVDKVVDKKGTRQVATAYLQYLYSKDAQSLLAKNNYRVLNAEVSKANVKKFPTIQLTDPVKVLGSWDKIQQTHFSSNGILDQLLRKKR